MLSKYAKGFLLTAMSIGALQVLPTDGAQAAGVYPCDGNPGVYIYKDANYTGTCNRVDIGDYADLASNGITNDDASSIKLVHPSPYLRYEATLYQHSNYQGAKSVLRFDQPKLDVENVGNDNVSSMKIRTIQQSEFEGVYLYDNPGFHGDWVKVTGPVSDLSTLSFNDRTTSIYIVGRYTGYVYTNAGFYGVNLKISSDGTGVPTYDLGARLDGTNNSISSISVTTY
ncbi:hypothetical protein [Brevibacillus dissolubilis]|uniref:hypothetical protein n=1 Tax=Brevibacillus dissolubilis TaxID=1844116 RepID=UPI00159BDC9D|nr:hypothetical protein [Brevibacillus dissolubilis]